VAGLISDALPKVIDARTHSIIDYIHAATNFVAGAMFRKSNPRASNAAYALGAAVLVNALCTDYQWESSVCGVSASRNAGLRSSRD